jgi:pimeloyl-ACP methyl ester carboxylesterase
MPPVADSRVHAFGASGGREAIYLHGTPGAPVEAELIAAAARETGVRLLAIDRTHVAPGLSGEAYLGALADLVGALGRGERLPILGFSIGAALGLRVAARLGSQAGPLLLFSTAGPLDVPGAFDGMGGGAHVFRAARRRGPMLEAVVGWQSFLGARAPGLLRRMLFTGAEKSDQAFASSAAGRELLERILVQAFADGAAGYRRDLTTYVEDWSNELARVSGPVEMWHGGGDTWAPLAMARNVAARCAADLRVGSQGHYTTLADCAGEALASLGGRGR